uniref:HSF-type DNA-binding domain-containing protein n=1 Tax=Latimeria chalumnae TaxID=7897 RepID=M3XIR7_LATCH
MQNPFFFIPWAITLVYLMCSDLGLLFIYLFFLNFQNGQNFCILDEQRFAKEILPRYFKHNNLSSFIRQLNMYGFRKVVSVENGLIQQLKHLVIEFQHPDFQRGKEALLENIKRKVSLMKNEESKTCQDNVDIQKMKDKQDSIESKLAAMKRENEALWKEVASLRRKHVQQQKVLNKIFQFIVTFAQRNCIIGVKRKRPLMIDASESPVAKLGRQCVLEPSQDAETQTSVVQKNAMEIQDSDAVPQNGVVVYDGRNNTEKRTEEPVLLAITEGVTPSGEGLLNLGQDVAVSETSLARKMQQALPSDPFTGVISAAPGASGLATVSQEVPGAEVGGSNETASFIDSILSESSASPVLDSSSILIHPPLP